MSRQLSHIKIDLAAFILKKTEQKMRTIRVKIYKFAELNDAAKEVAIQDQRNDPFNAPLDFFNDNAVEQINEAGFKGKVNLSYSLSYCQGDGLSFSCEYFDKLNDLFIEVLGPGKQKTIDTIINNCSFSNSGNSGHYSYASRNDIRFEFDDYSGTKYLIHSIVAKIEDKLQDLYLALCSELEDQGYDEISYYDSDECISENLIDNDYDFLENGKIYF